jgi:hypothetical protein
MANGQLREMDDLMKTQTLFLTALLPIASDLLQRATVQNVEAAVVRSSD